MEFGVIQEDCVPLVEIFSSYHLIMTFFGFFLCNLRIQVGIISYFFQLIEIEESFDSGHTKIHVQLLDCPPCLVFDLHWKVTCLTIDQPIRGHSKDYLESCSVGPQRIK